MSVLQGYLKGDLQKKQLIASIVEQFKLNLKNTRAPLVEHLKESKENSISIIFKSYVTKFDQKQLLDFLFCYTGLYAGWSVKEVIDNFFCKAFYRKS